MELKLSIVNLYYLTFDLNDKIYLINFLIL